MWDDRFMEQAKMISQWSKDPDHKVGAVIVGYGKEVIGQGYNGFPRGIQDASVRLQNKELKRKMMVHAEMNAILQSALPLQRRHFPQPVNFHKITLFCTRFPCTDCTKAIIQVGIERVVAPMLDESSSWYEDALISRDMLCEALIRVKEWT